MGWPTSHRRGSGQDQEKVRVCVSLASAAPSAVKLLSTSPFPSSMSATTWTGPARLTPVSSTSRETARFRVEVRTKTSVTRASEERLSRTTPPVRPRVLSPAAEYVTVSLRALCQKVPTFSASAIAATSTRMSAVSPGFTAEVMSTEPHGQPTSPHRLPLT